MYSGNVFLGHLRRVSFIFLQGCTPLWDEVPPDTF